MSGYTLTYKHHAPPGLTDGAILRPDVLGGLDRKSLERAVGEHFDVAGEQGHCLTVRNPPALSRLGAQMQRGTLIVEGDGGADLGASMAGGLIRVTGSAGDRVGGPDRDGDRGMTGGEIVVQGDGGDYVGLRQRAGLIVIGGKAGRSPGYRMAAGTIVVGRGPLDHPGLEMRRGTLICIDRQAQMTLGPGFAQNGTFDQLQAVRLVLRRVGELGVTIENAAMDGRFNHYSGDRFELNKGELLQWVC